MKKSQVASPTMDDAQIEKLYKKALAKAPQLISIKFVTETGNQVDLGITSRSTSAYFANQDSKVLLDDTKKDFASQLKYAKKMLKDPDIREYKKAELREQVANYSNLLSGELVAVITPIMEESNYQVDLEGDEQQ